MKLVVGTLPYKSLMIRKAFCTTGYECGVLSEGVTSIKGLLLVGEAMCGVPRYDIDEHKEFPSARKRISEGRCENLRIYNTLYVQNYVSTIHYVCKTIYTVYAKLPSASLRFRGMRCHKDIHYVLNAKRPDKMSGLFV